MSIKLFQPISYAPADFFVPASEGRALYDLSGSARKKLVIIRGAGHNDVMVAGREQYFREIESFVRMVSG
jgi:fermentation-respiration switch protein FrsA (DUF1100 family)